MSSGLYSGVSGLALGVGLNRGVSGLWGGASGLDAGFGSFSPQTALFSAGEQGVWYDPSDFSTMFQDDKGATPVTTAGQSVGLLLDKSRGLALGAQVVTNGDFSAGSTGWSFNGASWTISGGIATSNSVSGFDDINQSLPGLIEGRTYEVRIDIVSRTSGAIGIFLGASGSAGAQVATITTAGSYTFRSAVPVGEAKQILIRAQNGFIGSIDNISVRELPGNHATQPTAAWRPTYGIVPATGRRNLITFTEEFDNAAWARVAVTVGTNAATAPDGSLTADNLIPTAASAVRYAIATPGPSFGAGISSTYSAFVRPNGYGKIAIRESASTGAYASFDATTGTVIETGNAGVITVSNAQITSVGSGWFRISCTMQSSSGGGQSLGLWPLSPSYTTGQPSSQAWTGDGTSGILVWGAQLEVGSTATAYQRVVTGFEVTEAGVASRSYLSFDGTDDGMLTGTITPGTDKAQVFAGVRKLGTPAAILAELSVNAGTNLGSFYVVAPDSAAEYSAASHGSAGIAVNQASSVIGVGQSPDTAVISTLADIAADSTIIRRNGLAFPAGTGDQGTGNYLAYPLYIGRRGGTSLPLNAQIFGLIVRFGANLPAATITQTETWVGQRVSPTVNAPSFGPDLILNGDFASGANWTPTGGWSISAGAARQASVGFTNIISQTLPLTAGATYQVTFTVSSISSGSIFARISGGAIVPSAAFTAPGTYTVCIVAPASPTQLDIAALTSTVAVVDDVSMRLVT